MDAHADERASLLETLEALRRDVASLGQRVAAMEQAVAVPSAPGAAPRVSTPEPEGPTPEIIAAISAALAAYLGVKPHLRQVRLVGGASWAQQGRVTIQASHALALQRD